MHLLDMFPNFPFMRSVDKSRAYDRWREKYKGRFIPMTDWTKEREDVLQRFAEELKKATGDGSKKRQSGLKPPWYRDGSHLGAVFSHLTKWIRGEKVDPDSGAHPLVHAAWRLLAIACSENGNHPDAPPV